MYILWSSLIDTLRTYPEIAIFLTLAIGFWFGSLKFRSFSLGAVTSTLIAGLLVGQLHITVAPVVESTFFLMFLFAVGYSVGPQFFRALKKDGLPQVAFALIVCASGFLCAYLLGKLLGYDAGLTAGLLSGAYTNSGTLGVATSYFKQLNLGTDQAATLASLTAIAYAVTYPFGTAGAAWFLSTLAPRLLKIDLAASCKELEKTIGVHANDPDVTPWYRAVLTRAYRVNNQSLVGRKASELGNIIGFPDAFVRRARQDGAIVEADGGTVIQDGATLAIAGDRQAQLAAGRLVGPEVDDVELLSFPVEQLDVIVTDKMAAACTVQELQDVVMTRTGHRIFFAGLSRAGHEVAFSPATQLERHDVLTLIGAHGDVEKAARFLGYADRAGTSSDIAFMSIAVALGGLVGAITLHFGGIPLSLSPSVGVLVAGLICGQLRSVYRTFGRIPAPALWVFNNVGLNGFIAVVGLNAATGLIAGLRTYGLGLLLVGMVVSLVPLVVGVLLGKYVFRFHPGILLGACAGARSTTAALGAVQEAANSTIPAIGYTIPYAVSRIVMALGGVIIVVLMR
jgi:putative transport protein